jgi:hypothetical protein
LPSLRLRPWTVKAALPFVAEVHRRLPRVQGAMIAISCKCGDAVIGAALIGHPARVWMDDYATLAVLRVAVMEGYPNACSMLYGACSRLVRATGADNLVTYTHGDEHGTSLRAANWIDAGLTSGGEHDRPSRKRNASVDAKPKRRWFAPWSKMAKELNHD